MKKKNVLLFFTDDQRYNTIHALGCEEIKTPNLDQMVNEGTTFSHAHIMGGTCGAVCMPSRAMLLSGRSLFHLEGEGKRNGCSIPQGHKTIPEIFRENGYRTHHIGKWHQDRKSFQRSFDSADRIFGFTKGWYEAHGGHWNVAIHDFDPAAEYFEDDGYILDSNKKTKHEISPGNGGIHSTEMFCESAIAFIQNHHDERPFFMYLATVAPHDPRHSPEEFEEMYNIDNISTPENYMPKHPFDNGELYVRDEMLEAFPRRKHAIKRHLADYYSMISHIDYHFGKVMEALEEKGLMEDTIIVFAGDNGLALGQHGLLGKQSVYEHSIRVPLIIKGPGIKRDKKTEALCYLYDIFPTLCDLCDIDIPDSVEGVSMKPIIEGKKDKHRERLVCGYRNYQRSLREGKYKLIEYYVHGDRRTQLFDIQNDPMELNSLADKVEYKEVLSEMRQKLKEEQVRLDDPLVCKSEEALKSDKW